MSVPAESSAPYGGLTPPRRVRIPHLQAMKERGERWAMLTSYDALTAQVFDEAGIPVLLVGDSAANNVLGYDTTLPVSVEELLPLTRAVARGAKRALVVADLPFGSYQTSPGQALDTAVRFLKEGGAPVVGPLPYGAASSGAGVLSALMVESSLSSRSSPVESTDRCSG